MDADDIRHIAVVGAGLMGAGIALEFARAGYDVRLSDLSDDALQGALDSVRSSLEMLQGLGVIDAETAATAPDRIHGGSSLGDAVADADFVVEAVFEDLEVKRRVFADLDRLAPDRAILSSNTSSFMSSQLAPSTGRPGKVVVANWWNPPFLLPLVEVVRGPQTEDHTIETTCALLSKIGKRPVVLRKESLGFIGNRMQFALLREAVSIVEQGIATAEDVDEVVKNGFGRRLAVAGPFEVFEVAGWDTILHIVAQLFPDLETTPDEPALLKRMVERGELGVKSGGGFYTWNEESAAALRQRIAQGLATIERLSAG